jgi:hypothetical protein
MTTTPQDTPDTSGKKQSLSAWDYEGGAGPCGPKESTAGLPPSDDIPELTNTELVQLRVRVIALENLVTALLSGAPERQHDLARSMAAQISPRPGMTPHPLTTQAASHMNELVDRAIHYRDVLPE